MHDGMIVYRSTRSLLPGYRLLFYSTEETSEEEEEAAPQRRPS